MFGFSGEAILAIGAIGGMVIFTIAHVLSTVLEEQRRMDQLRQQVAVLQEEYARRVAEMQARNTDGEVDIIEDEPAPAEPADGESAHATSHTHAHAA